MKILLIGIASLAAFGFTMNAFQGKPVQTLKAGVGTKPGDIRKSLDNDEAARARGNELAIFAAG